MSAAASYWRNAVRHPDDCGIGNIRRTFDYSEFGNLAGEYPAYALPIGCLEKGAVPLRISTRVQTAVTGGTPAVTIGTATDPVAFAIAADIAAGSTGYKTAATGVEMGKALAADTMFFAYISASAATGKFTVAVEFANRRESVPFREDATDAGEGEEGGGSSAPAWVPENAKIHIDFVGGTPQGRAWVDGTGEVDVDTLLGADPNTENAWGESRYDPAGYVSDGYMADTNYLTGLIGAARTAVTGGATVVVRYKQVNASPTNDLLVIALMSADGNDAIFAQINAHVGDLEAVMQSYGGDLDVTLANAANVSIGAINVGAVTVTATRMDFAMNGGVAIAGVLSAVDRPPGNPLVAAAFTTAGNATEETTAAQSLTIYDPLPSTAGLSDLSAP